MAFNKRTGNILSQKSTGNFGQIFVGWLCIFLTVLTGVYKLFQELPLDARPQMYCGETFNY